MLRWNELLSEVRKEFPTFQLVRKRDSRFMLGLHIALLILTFGTMRRFMKGFTTTIGTTMYVSEDWDTLTEVERMIVLRHERVHMRQSREYGLTWFSFLYLLAFFPIGLAYYRMRFEKKAYEESMRALKDYRSDWHITLQRKSQRARYVEYFTSSEYGWMWPFRKSIESWYDAFVYQLLCEREEFVNRVTPVEGFRRH